MKKKDFLFLLLTTVAGLMFALGMCMCLVPEWNLFKPGVVVTGLGLLALMVVALAAWIEVRSRPASRSSTFLFASSSASKNQPRLPHTAMVPSTGTASLWTIRNVCRPFSERKVSILRRVHHQ